MWIYLQLTLSIYVVAIVSLSNVNTKNSVVTKLFKRLRAIPGLTNSHIWRQHRICIKLSENKKHQALIKHIDRKYQDVKHLKENGVITLKYCLSKKMIADILMKPLPKPISKILEVHSSCYQHQVQLKSEGVVNNICRISSEM